MKMFKNLSLFVLTAAFTAVAVVGCQKQMDDLAPAQAENPASMQKSTSNAPTNLVASEITRTNARISWLAPKGSYFCGPVRVGLGGYKVEYRVVGSNTWTQMAIGSPTLTSQYLPITLIPNTRYEYRVSAAYMCNGTWQFINSVMANFHTLCENSNTDTGLNNPGTFPTPPTTSPNGSLVLRTVTCGLNSLTDIDCFTFNLSSVPTCGSHNLRVDLSGAATGYVYNLRLEKLDNGSWNHVGTGTSAAAMYNVVQGGTYRIQVKSASLTTWTPACVNLSISSNCTM